MSRTKVGEAPVYETADPVTYTAAVGGAVAAKGPLAVLAVHGIGEQLPFETLGPIADGLARIEARRTGAAPRKRRFRRVRSGTNDLNRVEIDLATAEGGAQEVHLYESYWAPITKGKVTLADTISFLLTAGRTGLQNSLRLQGKTRRWAFGRLIDIGLGATTLGLLTGLVVLFALLLLNFLIVMVVGSLFTDRPWPSEALRDDLTTVVGAYALCALVLAVSLALGARLKDPGTHRQERGQGPHPVANVLLGFCIVLAWTAVLGLVLLSFGIVAGLPFLAYANWSQGQEVHLLTPFTYPDWLLYGFWGLLLILSRLARNILVDFPGDVAAYVQGHRLDKFSAVRDEIKRKVLTDARAILDARDGKGRPLYRGIAFVGHSLGSVIAYDLLNALIGEDLLAAPKEQRRVVDRTKLFLTYGSPLDKTAFLFATYAGATNETREAMANLRQPLLQDHRFRTFPWVNVWSRADLISSPLDFYDDPDSPSDQVHNMVDPKANLPLAAHNEYQKNTMVWEQLHLHLTR